MYKKGHCFLFKHGDVTTATHNPQNPLVLTYIHFDLTETPQLVPYRTSACRKYDQL